MRGGGGRDRGDFSCYSAQPRLHYICLKDVIGHHVYESGTQCLKDAVGAFGELLLLPPGKLNRPALGAVVFDPKNPSNLQRLNAIVWPHINRELQRQIDTHTSGILVVEAAVLIEAGWYVVQMDGLSL